MGTRDATPSVHEHPCGHDCLCCEPGLQWCDRCEIAEVVIRRHHLGDMPREHVLARLYLSMAMTAGDSIPAVIAAAVDVFETAPREDVDASR